MKKRTLENQFNYAISSSVKIGTSKRADRRGGVDIHNSVYSVQTAENLRNDVKSFCKFLKKNYPDIQMVREIKPEHFQAWINEHSRKWSDKTISEHISRINKLEAICNKAFGGCCFSKDIKAPERNSALKIRTRAFERNDVAAVCDYIRNNSKQGEQNNSLIALEIASRCGLRVKEIARLRTDCIDLDGRQIRIIEGAKNGRRRIVPIREKDIPYFENLIAQLGNNEYVTKGINEDSINRGIRRAIKALDMDSKYKSTTTHAVRKMYATERYKEEIESGKDERTAWCIVQQELGHGARFRPELFNTYIKK